MLHRGFERKPGLAELLRRDILRPIGRPADNSCDPAAIFEQTALVLGLKALVGEAGEMQHRPETIASVREVLARNRGAQSGIDAAEDHIKAAGKDIWLVVDHGNLTALVRGASCRQIRVCRPASGAQVSLTGFAFSRRH
jgi:hypothetical protein